MHIFVIALIFMSSVSAKLPLKMKQEEPKPCCSPSQFTQEVYGSTVSTDEGELLEEIVSIAFAYDSIEEKTSSRYHIGFTNGTEEYILTIIDYKLEESYTIFKETTGDTCYKGRVEHGFREACIPDNAKYTGSVTIGDRAMVVDIWAATETSGSATTESVTSYQEDECVPVSSMYRTFDTDKQLFISSFDVTNFKLGICDKEAFRVPYICNEPGLSEGEPKFPEQVLKLHRLGLTRAVGLHVGGK